MRLVFPSLLAVALAACDAPPKMHAASMTRMGDDVVVTFDAPLTNRASRQYWIALQRADAPETDTTGRVVLENGDRTVVLHAASPGDWEIRLHDGYPTKDAHLVARVPITVLWRADWSGPAID